MFLLPLIPRLRCLWFLHYQERLSIDHVKQLHAQLIFNNCLKSQSVCARLIQHYCATQAPNATTYAHVLVTHFDVPSLYLLNVFIRCALPRHSLVVFADWVSSALVMFDDFTYIFALGACARCSMVSGLWEGKQIHCRIVKHGFLSNTVVQTTAIHFYANSSDVESAKMVFDEMPVRNSATWNALIAGYCSQRDRVSEYARHALLLFRDMMVDSSGVKPTDTTMVSVLSAASRLGFLETGTCMHGYIEKTVTDPENDVYIGTVLVDMYAKCGGLDSALNLFMRMKDKNVLTWTAMATGLAIHGRGKQALELLNAMGTCGLKPNSVTFTSLLFGCCQAGLVEEGLFVFHNMIEKFRIMPLEYHYCCIVDLLGRAGHVSEASEFIVSMGVENDAILWRSLLHACKVHGNVVMGENVAKILFGMQQESSSEDYVALSNICASAERWDDMAMVRDIINIKGMDTKPAFSTVLA